MLTEIAYIDRATIHQEPQLNAGMDHIVIVKIDEALALAMVEYPFGIKSISLNPLTKGDF